MLTFEEFEERYMLANVHERRALFDRLTRPRATLEAENARLREAFDRFATHPNWCAAKNMNYSGDYDECNCGLAEMAEALQEASDE